MNRPLLGLAAILLVVMLVAIPFVYAKPTEAANSNNFISFIWHQQGPTPQTVVHDINPPSATDTTAKVFHDEVVWHLNPLYPNYIQIGEDSPITINAVTGYEGYMYVETTIFSPTYRTMNYRFYEKIMWDSNFIEIINIERGSRDTSGPVPVIDIGGIFVGQGIIDGQKVQVIGVREIVETTVPFSVECTGIIRFLGNAS